jgi:hypothetical protein
MTSRLHRSCYADGTAVTGSSRSAPVLELPVPLLPVPELPVPQWLAARLPGPQSCL